MHPLLLVFSFIFPDNSARGKFVFTTGGRLLLLLPVSIPFLVPSSRFLSASSSCGGVTDTVKAGLLLNSRVGWEQRAPCPSVHLQAPRPTAPLPSVQSQPILRLLKV